MKRARWMTLPLVVVLAALGGCATPGERAIAIEDYYEGNEQAVLAILRDHPEIANVRTSYGLPLIMAAAIRRHAELVARLLDAGADPNAAMHDSSSTLLHYMAGQGELAIVERLLDKGADPLRKDKWGGTPLSWAVDAERLEVVRRLLKEGYDLNALDLALLQSALAEGRTHKVLTAEPDPEGRKQALDSLKRREKMNQLLRGRRSELPGVSSLWRGAARVGIDRMKKIHEPHPVFAAIWRKGDDRFLACLQYPGVELFGTPYEVAILDRSMKLVRWGIATADQDYIPFALVEIRPTNDPGRGEWELAVAMCHPDRTPVQVYAVVPRWEDKGRQERYSDNDKTIACRWAEPGPSLLGKKEWGDIAERVNINGKESQP